MSKYNIMFLIFALPSCLIKAKEHIKKPKGSVSFALVLLINKKQEVLLLRRIGTSFGDRLYSLPGGKIESGETALEAAKREAQEEIGITIAQVQLAHVVDRQGTETEFYIFVFKPQTWHGTPQNYEHAKHDDICWFALNKLPENIIPAHLQAIELSQKNILYSTHGW